MFPGATPSVLDLLQAMLKFDPSTRPSAMESLSHSFLNKMRVLMDSSKSSAQPIKVVNMNAEIEKLQESGDRLRDNVRVIIYIMFYFKLMNVIICYR